MKPYLCLRLILPTVITGMPTMALESSTDIQRTEKLVNSNVAETQYGRRGMNGDREQIGEFGSRLGKRQNSLTLFCSAETCGMVDVNDCLQTVIHHVATTGQSCPLPNALINTPTVGDCGVVISDDQNQGICTPGAQVSAMAHAVFTACVNDTAIGSGGCAELENGVRVCIRNLKQEFVFCF